MTPSMRLSELLIGLAAVTTEEDRSVRGLASDSRRVRPGDLFLALRGIHHHGLEFTAAVERAGAVAIVWEPPHDSLPQTRLPLLAVPELSRRIGMIASRFFNNPCRSLTLIGITGTDGKTSTSACLAQVLSHPDRPCGVLGTLGYGVAGDLSASNLTTPDALTLWEWLVGLRDRGASYAVMEVSSHALDQGRADGLDFGVAVLTNLGRDHLDYHADQAAYAAAKRRLFIDLQPRRTVLNLDDAFGRELAEQLQYRVVGYGLDDWPVALAEYRVRGHDLQLVPDGLRLQVTSSWGEGELHSSLLGRFNAANLLAALATLLVLDWSLDRALASLAQVLAPPGRMERLGGDGRPLVVIDYAHTPQALEQVLRALHEHGHRRLRCVFGCGGERDPGKRPLMGMIAERWADQVIVTDDNPRREDPAAITDQILAGMRGTGHRVIHDRAAAIRTALAEAEPGDTVLIAGKGHEDYQIFGTERVAFSDREIVRAAFREQPVC